MVSAGPTREHLDPVRFISNPSTGKMGIALARAAADLGWDVKLVLGPTDLEAPQGVETRRVVSAADMYEELSAGFEDCDILIMTAAVSDMKPKHCAAHKVKKTDISYSVEFEPTIDILKTLSARKGARIMVGFAAETQDLESYALKKLEEKNLDCVAANVVGGEDRGFGADDNEILLITRAGEKILLPIESKEKIAERMLDIFEKLYFC